MISFSLPFFIYKYTTKGYSRAFPQMSVWYRTVYSNYLLWQVTLLCFTDLHVLFNSVHAFYSKNAFAAIVEIIFIPFLYKIYSFLIFSYPPKPVPTQLKYFLKEHFLNF